MSWNVVWKALMLVAVALTGATTSGSAQIDFRGLGHFQGNPFAPVQVVEFADYGCSACGMFTRDVKPRIVRDYIDTGRVGWRIIPIGLARFRFSTEATKAAECAAEQNRFWQVEQALYERQKEWQGARQVEPVLRAIAESSGLNGARWRDCYRDRNRPSPLDAHNQLARRLQVRGTPTFLINDRRAMGALPYEQFAELINQAEARAFQ